CVVADVFFCFFCHSFVIITEQSWCKYTSGTAPLNPCHALLQTYFSASFVILLLSLQNKVGVK
ncbi:hypothetical protein AAH014_20225, partial [Bacteroides uniformis]|uniref:hypothetical protein n=1 Tax=Bacteroides uniformis TaxID=820 RepID=UPI0039B65974